MSRSRRDPDRRSRCHREPGCVQRHDAAVVGEMGDTAGISDTAAGPGRPGLSGPGTHGVT
eukprot:763303-Hanusia_phi.AAC.4